MECSKWIVSTFFRVLGPSDVCFVSIEEGACSEMSGDLDCL
jgi:hypothetical protein